MANKTAAIIDYGVGNIRSVTRTIQSTKLNDNSNIDVVLTRDRDRVLDADLIVLPGVGSFQSAAEQLLPWRTDLARLINSGKPTIGMCLGMQLMFDKSEEGPGQGLGVIPGVVTRLTSSRVPHMGWNQILDAQGDQTSVPWAYFAHSFACRPTETAVVKGWTTFENDTFASIVRSGNILGTQFHPEKSDIAGIELVHNFVREVLS